MNFTIEFEQEEDGRWIAEIVELAGVLVYGGSREEAVAKVQALALRVLADRLEHGEAAPELMSVSFGADGASSAIPALTVSSLVPTGRMWSLPSMTKSRSALGCSLASPRPPA